VAVFEASKQVDLFDRETGRPYESGIAMLDVPKKIHAWNAKAKKIAAAVIEKGGVVDRATRKAAADVNSISESVNDWVYAQTRALLIAGKMPVILGGDHSVPYGSMLAYAETHPNLGILHLDAHADLRDAYEGFTWSHASIFHNVMTKIGGVDRLVQVGVRDLSNAESAMIENSNGRIVTFFDSDLATRKEEGAAWAEIADEIIGALPNDIYLSWDIDGLDPTLCPSTGTPVPGGLSWNEAIGLLRAIHRAGKRRNGVGRECRCKAALQDDRLRAPDARVSDELRRTGVGRRRPRRRSRAKARRKSIPHPKRWPCHQTPKGCARNRRTAIRPARHPGAPPVLPGLRRRFAAHAHGRSRRLR